MILYKINYSEITAQNMRELAMRNKPESRELKEILTIIEETALNGDTSTIYSFDKDEYDNHYVEKVINLLKQRGFRVNVEETSSWYKEFFDLYIKW